jgi:hypothetical protein
MPVISPWMNVVITLISYLIPISSGLLLFDKELRQVGDILPFTPLPLKGVRRKKEPLPGLEWVAYYIVVPSKAG